MTAMLVAPQHHPSRAAGGDPQSEQQRDGQARRGGDHPVGAAVA
ncbi:hypothetical protein OHA25_11620 [Nonomuraea sp. NBC_00507]